MSKPLAKSLHTVTVLVNVARYYKATHDGITVQDSAHAALAILGYDVRTTSDTYGLLDKAIAILNATR